MNYANTTNPFNIKYVNGLKATIGQETFEDAKENCDSPLNRSKENVKGNTNNECDPSMSEILKKLNQNIVLQNGSQKPALEVLDSMLKTEVFNKERKIPVKEVIMTFESVKQKAIDDATKEMKEAHSARVSQYENDIEKFRDQLIQSNLRIGTLEKCSTTTNENANLKQENKRLSDEMMIGSKKQIEDLNAQIKSNEEHHRLAVEKLKVELAEKLKVELAEKDAKIDGQKSESAAQLLSWQLAEGQMKQKLTELNAAVEKYQNQIKELNADIICRDEKIKETHSEMIETVQKSKIKVDILEETVAARDDQRKKEVSEMTAKMNEMDEVHSKNLSQSRDEMAAQAKTYDRKVEDLNAQLQQCKGDHNAAVLVKEAEHKGEILAVIESKTKAVKDLRAELKESIETAENERSAAYEDRDRHKFNYTKERKMRITLHNELVELQGNIRVICRVRPVNEYELESTNGGSDLITNVLSDSELAVSLDRRSVTGEVSSKSARVQKFEFDKVFGCSSSQEEVFEAVQPLCISFLDGFNICIFAYGQTGSGKTFTMEGNGTGVSPRCMVELFDLCEERKEQFEYKFTFSMTQIHNDSVYDLLGNLDTKLTIHHTEGGKFEITDALETELHSAQQALELIARGQSNRVVAAHSLNQDSSRSHLIITIKMTGVNKIDGVQCAPAKLHLIDLAGSERLGKTGAKGESLVEANSINKSLLALGDVVNALATKASHVPYRNSKLTFLLQESLGGSSKVFTFVNISPAQFNSGETVCSLNFAARCRLTNLAKEDGQGHQRRPFETVRSASPVTPTGAAVSAFATTAAVNTLKATTSVTNISAAIPNLGTTTPCTLLQSRTPPPKRSSVTSKETGWNSYSKGNIVL